MCLSSGNKSKPTSDAMPNLLMLNWRCLSLTKDQAFAFIWTVQTSSPRSNGGVTSNKVLSVSIQTHMPGVLAADKTADNETSLVTPRRAEVSHCLFWSCWKGNKWALRLPKANLVKEARARKCNPQDWDILGCWCMLCGGFIPGGARKSTVRQTVFIFQLEQFTALFCNSFPLVKLVSALFTCTPTVAQTPDHRHLETLSCLNCLDWSELSGTTKLTALKLEFVITRVKISVDQSRGLKRTSCSLSLVWKTRKMCVRHESLLLFFVFEHHWLCSPCPTVKTTTQEQQGEKMQNKYACVPCNHTDDMCTYNGDQGPW